MIKTKNAISSENAIAASWERCERTHRLVRDAADPIMRLQSSEIAPRLDEVVERTGGRRGVIRQLAEIAIGAGQCLIVTDADGIVVRIESEHAARSEFEHHGIALGSCWDERVAGTNGVSMAMVQNGAFTVRGKDHFFSALNPFACTGMPLFDADNQVIGAIILSSFDRGNPAEFAFAQQLLRTATGKIQRVLFEQRFQDALLVSVSATGQDALLQGTEVVALDEAGIIVGSTAGTHQILDLTNVSDLKGMSFEAVFGADVRALDGVPERVLSVPDTRKGLTIATQLPDVAISAGRGWRPVSKKPNRKRIRRRLPPSLRELATGSEVMATILERAQAHFERAYPILIEGETGTGKSALVAALHSAARLPPTQMVIIDCAMLDSTSEDRDRVDAIFGRVRAIDSFDNTDRDTTVLVFDNVDEMPGYFQASLRNLLADLEAGDSSLDAGWPASALRVLSTCRRPLKAAVDAGDFRDDLYFLLGATRLELPPLRLREHPEALARALATHMAGAEVELSDEAKEAVRTHAWPGNVRELHNTLRQALLDGDGRRISLHQLKASATFTGKPAERCEEGRVPSARYDEKSKMLDALQGAHWNVSQAARSLGMGRATIHRKMKRYGIVRPTGSEAVG